MTSHLRELVEREAAQAEAEDEDENGESEAEDEDENGEPEAEPEDETPPPPAYAFDEKAFEREQARHEKAMAKVLGDQFEHFGACDLCGGVGFVPSGVAAPPEVKLDPDAIVCEDCNGWGRRLTGSLAEGSESIPCTPCGGAGWRDRRTIAAAAQVSASPAPAPPDNGPAAALAPGDPAVIADLEARGYVVVKPSGVISTVGA